MVVAVGTTDWNTLEGARTFGRTGVFGRTGLFGWPTTGVGGVPGDGGGGVSGVEGNRTTLSGLSTWTGATGSFATGRDASPV